MARPGLDVRAPEVHAVVKEFGAAQKLLNKELRRSHKEIAVDIAGKVNRRAGGTAGFRRFGSAWAGTGTISGAKLYLKARSGGGGALSAFAGRRPRTRSGWNAATYRNGVRLSGRRFIPPDRPQAHPWIGNSYVVGLPGEGPYVVRDVAPAEAETIGDRYQDAFQRATSKIWGNR